MKKLFATACLALLFATASAQKKDKPAAKDTVPPPPQVFTLQGSQQEFSFLLYYIDNPTKVSHVDAINLRDWIFRQLQKQTPPQAGPK